jgi:PncC family amidohydrolase
MRTARKIFENIFRESILEESFAEQPLEIQVGEWLRRRGLKLIAAESCTGGLISHRMTDVPGSSDYFLGGLVSYANEAKHNWLGVREETLAAHGAVSKEVVLEMARGARHSLAAAHSPEQVVAVSVSGIAGPGGGSPEKPVGLVWIGLSAPGYEKAFRFFWQGTRVENKARSAEQALRLILEYLRGEVD